MAQGLRKLISSRKIFVPSRHALCPAPPRPNQSYLPPAGPLAPSSRVWDKDGVGDDGVHPEPEFVIKHSGGISHVRQTDIMNSQVRQEAEPCVSTRVWVTVRVSG